MKIHSEKIWNILTRTSLICLILGGIYLSVGFKQPEKYFDEIKEYVHELFDEEAKEFQQQLTTDLDNYGLRVYNVKFYGALGNDPGDGTGTDDYAAFAAAIAAMPNEGGILYIPAATVGLGYRISTRLQFQKNVIIQGDGNGAFPFYTITSTPMRGATNIFYTRGDNQLFYFTTNGATNRYPSFSIKDLAIKCVSATTPVTGSAGIYIDSNVQQFKIENTTVEAFDIDINIVSGWGGLIQNCIILSPYTFGIKLDNNIQPDVGGTRIDHCFVISGFQNPQLASAIYMKSGGGIWISDTNFNAANTLVPATTFLYGFIADFAGGNTSEIKIQGCNFNNYQTTGIKITNAGPGSPAEFTVANCNIAPQNAGASYGIDIQGTNTHHFRSVGLSNIVGQNTAGLVSGPFVNLAYIDGIRAVNIVPASGGWSTDIGLANCTNIGQPMNVSTVNVVSPTSPNRTITVEIGGTTYYVAAKTTNN